MTRSLRASLRGVGIVFRKEMREILRDRRTLLVMIVVPIVLYPGLMVISEQLALFGMRQLEADPPRVAVAGEPSPDLRGFLERREDLDLEEVHDPMAALRNGEVEAVLILRPDEASEESANGTRSATLFYNGADARSQRGRQVFAGALRAWGDTLLSRRLTERGLPESFARPLAVADSSVARPEELGGMALGRFLPMLLILITLLGTFYPAIDLAAGEKERGTLETLLTAPVPAGEIVAGKFLTVAAVGIVAAALNLGSMLLTFQAGLFQMGGELELDFSLPLRAVLLIFATLVPLAILFGALFLGIAIHSRSFKEAQNALTPVYMLVLIPALLPLFPGIDFTPPLALVPVAGVALFFRELMGGQVSLLPGLLALLSTAGYAWLALTFASRAFGRESVLFGVGEPEVSGRPGRKRARSWWKHLRPSGGEPGARPSPEYTFAFIVAIALVFFYLGITLRVRLGEAGMLLSQWLLLFLPAVLFVLLGRFDFRETFSLRAPARRDLAGAALVIAGGTPIAWFLSWLQSFVLPLPVEFAEDVARFLLTDDPLRIAWLLFLMALTPAICEEFVFRGVLLAGTRTRFSPARLMLLNGAVFGAFHLSFETVFRFLPTAWLGVLMAGVVWKTRSIWTGVLMHSLNNGVIVLLVASPFLQERFAHIGEAPPLLLLPVAVLLLASGVRILQEKRDEVIT